MAKGLSIAIVAMFVVVAFCGTSATTEGVKPGTDFNGPHYTLNILGKKNIGNGNYDNPDRHTIFVPLEGDTNITMVQGDKFAVLDGNGVDVIAIFQIPNDESKSFKIYIVSLGKPGDGTDVSYPDGWTYNNDTGLWYVEIATVKVNGHSKPIWVDATEWSYLEYEWATGGIIWEGYM